jgi:hypothetical protein
MNASWISQLAQTPIDNISTFGHNDKSKFSLPALGNVRSNTVGRAECEPEEEYPPLTATLIVALMPVEARAQPLMSYASL